MVNTMHLGDNTETLFLIWFGRGVILSFFSLIKNKLFFSCDGSSELVPSTSSEPVDNQLPTQEGKLTSQDQQKSQI